MIKPDLYIGLMSGTSADGIDLALVDFESGTPKVIASHFQAYTPEIQKKITSLYTPNANEIDQAFALDKELAHLFANAIKSFLQDQNLDSTDIIAIGNHGQTIRHRPVQRHPFTLQIGCSQTLATLTNIRVIGEFRKKDIALGGQGAPLVPAFHKAMFKQNDKDVFVVNIGGIANITYLPSSVHKTITGFDTGPGNALLDDWFQLHNQGRFDKEGNWASEGSICEPLLNALLEDNYFGLPAPKSTGREAFNLDWLSPFLASFKLSANDCQTTLSALTAHSIADQISALSSESNILLCGGGSHNKTLVNQIIKLLPSHEVATIDKHNITGDNLESVAFAWLAYAYDKKINGNISAVTGATKETVLGNSFLP